MDRRNRRSKGAIENAFLQLLREKSFYNITVEEIVDRAGYSKPTFYANYLDKYDLLEQIISRETEEFIDSLFTILEQGSNYRNWELAKSFFARVKRNDGLYRFIFNKGMEEGQKMYEDKMVAHAKKKLDIEALPGNSLVDPEFVHRMSARSYMDFIRFWVDEDFRHSDEWMAANYIALVSSAFEVRNK